MPFRTSSCSFLPWLDRNAKSKMRLPSRMQCELSCTNTAHKTPYKQDKVFAKDIYRLKPLDVKAIQWEIMTNGPVTLNYHVFDDFPLYKVCDGPAQYRFGCFVSSAQEIMHSPSAFLKRCHFKFRTASMSRRLRRKLARYFPQYCLQASTLLVPLRQPRLTILRDEIIAIVEFMYIVDQASIGVLESPLVRAPLRSTASWLLVGARK